MTVGIYALYWEEQDLIYIGQSQNIERRLKEHLRDLGSNSHSNYKVQNCFNSFGDPSTSIIEITSIDFLNDREIYWTKEFDTINNGLNIIEAGLVGYGTNSNASKYTKLQILLCFRRLYSLKEVNYRTLARELKVHVTLLHSIKTQQSHTWLNKKYPRNYQKMLLLHKNTIRISSITSYHGIILLSPDNIEYSFMNLSEFCRVHSLSNSHMSSVIRRKRKSHNGWRLKVS